MKKICLFVMFLLVSFTLFGCSDKKSIKNEYESLNGKKDVYGDEYRKVNISEYNPIVYTDAKTIIKKIEKGDTFYVFFGSKMDQWCRSVIEKAIDVMNNNGIKEVYYVEVLDDEGKEILRDRYALDEDKFPSLVVKSTKEYETLLGYFDTLLEPYKYESIKNSGEELNLEEKRIYIPAFIYIEGGVPLKITNGLSDKQEKSTSELNTEILMEVEKKLSDLFIVQ